MRSSLSLLRVLATIAPVSFFALVLYLVRGPAHEQLHNFPGYLYLLAVVTVVVSGFSWLVFRIISRLEQNRNLSILNEIAAAAAENPELEELLKRGLDVVLEVAGAEAGLVWLVDEETHELAAACHHGISDELAAAIRAQKPADEPIGAGVARTGRSIVNKRLLEDAQVTEIASREGFRSAVGLPLESEGEAQGVLGLIARHDRVFRESELALLTSMAAQLGLAARNALLFRRAQQRNRELAALVAVGQAVSSTLELNDVLDEALEAIIRMTSAGAAEVWLAEDDGMLVLARQRGPEDAVLHERTRLSSGEGLPGLAAEKGSAVIVNDLPSDPRFACPTARAPGFETFCALPLVRGGESVGVLAVASRDREACSGSAEQRLLAAIGEQLAIAVDKARLQERVLDRAVLEERERLGRELHDSLAQVLGYVNMETLAIKKLLSSGRRDEAERQVVAMEERARRLYTDVHEAILGLHMSQSGFVPALREYAADYGPMAGTSLSLDICPEVEELRLPASMEIQLVRIVQEALSNVRKHARASAAIVRVEATDGELAVKIADDGRGFDVARRVSIGWPRFGLQTMRERAEAIGGEFAIASSPGGGTSVTVRVPLAHREEVEHAGRSG